MEKIMTEPTTEPTTEPATTKPATTARPPATRRPWWLLPVAALATLFGVASVVAGGRVLFGSAAARAAEGDYVPFVLWFNFLAGFASIAAGVALGLARPWAARIALAIAAATVLVYAALGVHVLLGGAFTRHTVMAMALRTTVWIAIAALACQRFGCRRSKRLLGAVALVVVVLIGATTCGSPADTVKIHAGGGTTAPAAGRARAPRMSIKDHKERELAVPVPGRITVLSFASRSTADRGSERCRAVRVAHPEIEILEVMDVSSAPGFLAGKVKSKLADRHQTILADTTQAFAAAHKPVPADLDARIHIVADWSGAAFEAYGATGADDHAQIMVIDGDGGVVEFFATTPSDEALAAAVSRAGAVPASSTAPSR
jgi:hypothetical protein